MQEEVHYSCASCLFLQNVVTVALKMNASFIEEKIDWILSYNEWWHKKMLSLTIEEFESWKCHKVFCICKEESDAKDKHYRKVRDHYHFTGKYRTGLIVTCCTKRNSYNFAQWS